MPKKEDMHVYVYMCAFMYAAYIIMHVHSIHNYACNIHNYAYTCNTNIHSYVHTVFIHTEAQKFISHKQILTWCVYEPFLNLHRTLECWTAAFIWAKVFIATLFYADKYGM